MGLNIELDAKILSGYIDVKPEDICACAIKMEILVQKQFNRL
jgi:hypothetical protein